MYSKYLVCYANIITNLIYTCKISHLVASCQQPVSKLCSHCLSQVWNKLLTTCDNLVDIIRLVTRLFQQVCYSLDITILLQPCVVNLVTFLSYHDCIRLVSYCHYWSVFFIALFLHLLENTLVKKLGYILLGSVCSFKV